MRLILLLRWSLNTLRSASHQFTDTEAWQLFRLAAIAEAVGWTSLISGIIITDYLAGGNRDAVIIAGQIHGILFLIYMVAAVMFSFRLRWSFLQTILAVGAGVVPYGSLVFEWYISLSRQQTAARDFYYSAIFKSFPSH